MSGGGLRLESIRVTYGHVVAVDGLTLSVAPGELVALVGANGAGKSTTLRAISGLVPLRGGEIYYNDKKISGVSPERLVHEGLIHVPEGRRVFPGLTVRENLVLAARSSRRYKKGEGFSSELDAVLTMFPRLRERFHQRTWSLSGGEQQMLAIGRGVVARPKILLLDEPSLGLAPQLVEEVFETVSGLNRQGMGVLLVEQNSYMALQISSRAYVLENGGLSLAGPSEALSQDPRVKRAYLGEG